MCCYYLVSSYFSDDCLDPHTVAIWGKKRNYISMLATKTWFKSGGLHFLEPPFFNWIELTVIKTSVLWKLGKDGWWLDWVTWVSCFLNHEWRYVMEGWYGLGLLQSCWIRGEEGSTGFLLTGCGGARAGEKLLDRGQRGRPATLTIALHLGRKIKINKGGSYW